MYITNVCIPWVLVHLLTVHAFIHILQPCVWSPFWFLYWWANLEDFAESMCQQEKGYAVPNHVMWPSLQHLLWIWRVCSIHMTFRKMILGNGPTVARIWYRMHLRPTVSWTLSDWVGLHLQWQKIYFSFYASIVSIQQIHIVSAYLPLWQVRINYLQAPTLLNFD